ncbi:MAG: hypothetical protein CM1200mP9_12060 [Gammaproteobacteria bacterium]|nr:MAG: hypothetical protein CM1200mP9_12060 [Gammaproteobacteria bacterium]
MIAGRAQEKNERVSQTKLIAMAGNPGSVRCDVGELEDIDAAIAETINAFGGLQILVNNGGNRGG